MHQRKKWRDFVETIDQKTDLTKLWRTIKGIDGRAKREAENETITFNGISFSSSKQLATKFNQQFNTSKLGRHNSSRETRVVTRETKSKPLEMTRTFTADLVIRLFLLLLSCHQTAFFHLSTHFRWTSEGHPKCRDVLVMGIVTYAWWFQEPDHTRMLCLRWSTSISYAAPCCMLHQCVMKAIKSSRNSKAFGPDKLSIFHLKHLGPMAIEYITTLFNLSVTTCQIPAIWKSSSIYRSLARMPSRELITGQSRYSGISALTHNQQIYPPCSRPTRVQTWTLNHLGSATVKTDIAVGFTQRKPPDRTVCVAVDLSAAFDIVCHNNLLSKINSSLRPRRDGSPVIWEVDKPRLVSPSLFSFYISDMPRPTDPVKRVCYADDLTVWASGVNIPDLEVSLNNYLEEITVYPNDTSLLISAPVFSHVAHPRHTPSKDPS